MTQAPQIREGKYADVMPDMSDEEYQALKRSIKENGFDETQPIILDEDGNVVDGHHRERASEELGVEPVYENDPDADPETAYRRNLARRNLTGGQLREVVKNYLEDHFGEDRTQAEVAADLGVSEGTVSNAWTELNPEEFTREEKRQQVADYRDRNPDASNREVARNVKADVSHTSVNNWREEWASAEPEEEEDEYDYPEPDELESVPEEEWPEDQSDLDESAQETRSEDSQQPQESTDGQEVGQEQESADEPPAPAEGEGNSPTTAPTEPGRDTESQKRADELEAVLEDIIRYFHNQDPEGLERAVSRAEGML